MRAGVVELANLCSTDGSRFLTFADAADACAWLRHFDTQKEYDDLVAFLDAVGVAPVEGRAPWAAADVKRGIVPPYAPPGFGEAARAARDHGNSVKASGDGACGRPQLRGNRCELN